MVTFYINIEALKDICKDILVIDINQEDFNKSITKTCPQVYTNGKSLKWTGKAIAGFLNDKFNTKLFTF